MGTAWLDNSHRGSSLVSSYVSIWSALSLSLRWALVLLSLAFWKLLQTLVLLSLALWTLLWLLVLLSVAFWKLLQTLVLLSLV